MSYCDRCHADLEEMNHTSDCLITQINRFSQDWIELETLAKTIIPPILKELEINEHARRETRINLKYGEIEAEWDEGCGCHPESNTYSFPLSILTDPDGFIADIKAERAKEAREKQLKKERVDADLKAKAEIQEKAQYERLKAKFEVKP